MRQVVRGRTEDELINNVEKRKKTGWVQITENKLDTTDVRYNTINWVCVMELEDDRVPKKRKWGFNF